MGIWNPVVYTFHLILDHFIQPSIDGIIHVVPFRDLTPFVCRALAVSIAIVQTIQKPDHSKSRRFCPDFKWFLTKWRQFVRISNGWALGFQMPFKIQTICNPTSFGPFEIQTRSDYRSLLYSMMSKLWSNYFCFCNLILCYYEFYKWKEANVVDKTSTGSIREHS